MGRDEWQISALLPSDCKFDGTGEQIQAATGLSAREIDLL